MIETEIAIVGAGIAGNYLAYLLRQQNIPCLVLEKQKSLLNRPLQCAGIISQKILQLVSFPKEIIINQVKNVLITTPNGHSSIIKGQEHPLIIDRIKFDAYFGQQAIKLGAQYLFNAKYLKHAKLKDGKILILTTKERVICKLVVGADGPGSKVARNFGIHINSIPAAQVRVPFPYKTDQTSMIFDPSWKELFGYIVPENVNHICRIGVASKRFPGKALKKLLSSLNIDEKDIIDKQGGLIPFGYPQKLVLDQTVLIGDAASMVKATTGGGIIMGVSAVKLLANAIQIAYSQNRYTQDIFMKFYHRPFHRKLGIELVIHYLIRLFLLKIKPEDFQKMLVLYENQEIKSIIWEHADMDFPLQLILKLMRKKVIIGFIGHLIISYPSTLIAALRFLLNTVRYFI
jgi:flavin-dependent dehydrogenase